MGSCSFSCDMECNQNGGFCVENSGNNTYTCTWPNAVYTEFVSTFSDEAQCQTFCLGIISGSGPAWPNNMCKTNMVTGGTDCFVREAYDGCPSLCNDKMSNISSQLPNSCEVSGTTYNLNRSGICDGSCACSLGYGTGGGSPIPDGSVSGATMTVWSDATRTSVFAGQSRPTTFITSLWNDDGSWLYAYNQAPVSIEWQSAQGDYCTLSIRPHTAGNVNFNPPIGKNITGTIGIGPFPPNGIGGQKRIDFFLPISGKMTDVSTGVTEPDYNATKFDISMDCAYYGGNAGGVRGLIEVPPRPNILASDSLGWGPYNYSCDGSSCNFAWGSPWRFSAVWDDGSGTWIDEKVFLNNHRWNGKFLTRARDEGTGTIVNYNNNYGGNTPSMSPTQSNSSAFPVSDNTTYLWWVNTRDITTGAYSYPYMDNIYLGERSMCDGVWREVPGGGTTESQPVLWNVTNHATLLRNSIVVAVRGTDNRVYYKTCEFFSTSNLPSNLCRWYAVGSGWREVPGNQMTDTSPRLFNSNTPNPYRRTGWEGWPLLDLLVSPLSGSNRHTENANSLEVYPTVGWTPWYNDNSTTPNFGRPLSTTDPVGRTWRFKKNPDNTISYSCGANNCMPLPFNPSRSSVVPSSPTVVNIGDPVTVYCDYNSVLGNITHMGPVSTGLSGCVLTGHDKTRAQFNCTVSQAGGEHNVYCNTYTGTSFNLCEQSNLAGSIMTPGGGQTLTVSKGGSGTGTVTSNPAGINCGTSCPSQNASFTSGVSVTLSQSAGAGSTFSGWSGACSGTGACTVLMDSAKSVNASFNLPVPYTLSVIKSGQGTVTSTSNPSQANINCGSKCSTSYESGTTVTLTAMPSTGRVFTGWGGACSGTPKNSNCTITMPTGSVTVIVNFAVDPNYREF